MIWNNQVNGSKHQKRETRYMALITKNEKKALEEFYFVMCRLLTENGTLSWVFLIHFAIEIYRSCYQMTQSIV